MPARLLAFRSRNSQQEWDSKKSTVIGDTKLSDGAHLSLCLPLQV